MPITSARLDLEISTQAGIEPLVRALAENNPYRVLGIYSNSTKKEQLANASRMAAFLRVQRQITFPSDSIDSLHTPLRTEESVNNASAAIALPAQRLSHALFWFLSSTQEDAEALTKLAQGKRAAAEGIWIDTGGASSLHNLALHYLLTERGDKAIPLLEKLYAEHALEFGQLIDESLKPTEAELVEAFLSILLNEASDRAGVLAPYVSRDEWKERLSQYETERLMQLIKVCDEHSGTDANEKLEMAQQLARNALPILQTLKMFMGDNSPAYTNLADQVATQVLQGAIYYYNKSDTTPDAINASLRMMKLARSIARGNAVIQRCAKNIDAVQMEQDEQPSHEAGSEGEAVYRILKSLERKNPEVEEVRSTLKAVSPYLKKLKIRLGPQHAAYLKLSTQVVKYSQNTLNIMLAKALEKMASAREYMERERRMDAHTPQSARRIFLSPASYAYYDARASVKKLLTEIWDVLRKLEFYDMEPQFRKDSFNKDRRSVEKLCVQVEVQTTYYIDTIRRHPHTFCVLAAIIIMLTGWLILSQQQKHENQWGTEYRAWATVQQDSSLKSCLEYLKLYPYGSHVEQVKKKAIDAEVDEVFSRGRYGKLPTTQRSQSSYSSTATISVRNDTKYPLTLLYSGTSSKKLEIPPNGTKSIQLPSATYRIVAKSDEASKIRPFAGTETYSGGSYHVTYYISSYRY